MVEMDAQVREVVVPARAGMSRVRTRAARAVRRGPCTRRDEPDVADAVIGHVHRGPCTRRDEPPSSDAASFALAWSLHAQG